MNSVGASCYQQGKHEIHCACGCEDTEIRLFFISAKFMSGY